MSQAWGKARLGDLCRIALGRTPSRGDLRNFDPGKTSGHVWLSIADLPANGCQIDIVDSREHLSDKGAEQVPIVSKGTLLVSFKLSLGRLAYAGVDLRTNEAIAALCNLDEHRISKAFLHWYLTYFDWDKAAENDEKLKGKTLNKAKLSSLYVPLPPIEEQQRIVAFLDEAFEGAGSAIANAEQSLEHATTLFETSRRALFSEQEREWGTKPIASICENLDGLRRPVTKHNRESGDVPYYGASGVVDHVRDYLFDEDLLLVSEDGANLVMRNYPIAFSIAGPAWVNNHAHVLRFSDLNTQKFVEHYLNSIDLKPFISGMAQPKLNQGSLNTIQVPMPPLNVRMTIIRKLDALQAEISSLSRIYARKLAILAELKQSLLAYTFSGQLTREQPEFANDNSFATPEQVANLLAVLHSHHEQIGRNRTFGRVKAQKGLHLIESVGRVELGRTPWKDVAGPNDFPHMLKAEGWAKKQRFFEFVPRSDGGYDFVKLEDYRVMIGSARAAIKPIEDAVQKVIDLIAVLDSREAEVVATVHAAWNNLILDGIELTDDAIIREARDNWHPKKLRIPEVQFHDAIRLIRQKCIIPDGSAKRVAHRQQNLL